MKKMVTVRKNVSLMGNTTYFVLIDGIAVHSEDKRKNAEKICLNLKKAFLKK